jgi:hypothetical protein
VRFFESRIGIDMGFECTITTRQYGEVVLPDASAGNGTGALADNVSRRKEGMAHFLPSGYKVSWVDAGSRYKVDKWTIICPGLK